VSNASSDLESLHALARLELLQGIQGTDAAGRRRRLYNRFGAPEDPWVRKARVAYESMHHVDGFVASVGDQLSCELDVREHADLYAAVGGFDVSQITQGLGAWWSPSATWFESGRSLAAQAGLANPDSEDFEAMSRLLLDAGAHNLATFFFTVATGGLELISSSDWLWRRSRKELAFVVEVARVRGLLFQDGPDENGRYLREEDVKESDILGAFAHPKRERPFKVKLLRPGALE